MQGKLLMGLLLSLALAAAIPVSAAEMYQWVDENGKRHFTDKPPPSGIASEKAPLKSLPPITKTPDVAVSDDIDAVEARERAREQREIAAEKRREKNEKRYEEDRLRREQEAEDEIWRKKQKAEADKEEKCKRLKAVADQAYSFKSRYERECK